MANSYFTASGNPATGSDGLSALMRGEFLSIQTAFDLVPHISTTGSFDTVFIQQGDFTFTLPAASGTLATTADVAAEATARAGADTTEIAARNTAITAATATEVAARNTAIGVETTARTAADAAEVTARTAAAAGHLSGLSAIYNTSTTLDVDLGTCTDSTGTATITLPARISKVITAPWAAGTGNGGMPVGLPAAASTWYHVFVIRNSGATDVYLDISPVANNKPAGTTAFRRIGQIKLDGSVHIVPFDQYNDRFMLRTPVFEYSGASGVTTAVTLTLSAAAPNSIAILTGDQLDISFSNAILYLSALIQDDLVPGATGVTCQSGPSSTIASYYAEVAVNASSQMRRRSNSATTVILIVTNGWIDTRGRG